jgi:hypothetical protein
MKKAKRMTPTKRRYRRRRLTHSLLLESIAAKEKQVDARESVIRELKDIVQIDLLGLQKIQVHLAAMASVITVVLQSQERQGRG